MKVYNYHSETKEYLGEQRARMDPLETEKQKTPIYLVPAHATAIKLKVQPKQGEVAVFDLSNTTWNVVVDNRGMYYEQDGTSAEITMLDVALPANATRTPPPDDLIRPNWDGKNWVEAVTQAELDAIANQVKIADEIKLLAVESLIAKGELPSDFEP